MLKSRKVKRMLLEHSVERDNYTLVLRLQNTIQQPQQTVDEQQRALQSSHKHHLHTRVQEMEVEIQQLHD